MKNKKRYFKIFFLKKKQNLLQTQPGKFKEKKNINRLNTHLTQKNVLNSFFTYFFRIKSNSLNLNINSIKNV